MKNFLVSIVVVFMLCASSPASLLQNDDNDVIDKFISKQAIRETGDEYPEARKVVQGDLNHDGISDLAVLYTIEGQHGTNNYKQYLAVFTRIKGRLVAASHSSVGGKMYRAVELQSVSNNRILLSTLNYAALDATCCPSIKGVTRYALVKGRLRQL